MSREFQARDQAACEGYVTKAKIRGGTGRFRETLPYRQWVVKRGSKRAERECGSSERKSICQEELRRRCFIRKMRVSFWQSCREDRYMYGIVKETEKGYIKNGCKKGL